MQNNYNSYQNGIEPNQRRNNPQVSRVFRIDFEHPSAEFVMGCDTVDDILENLSTFNFSFFSLLLSFEREKMVKKPNKAFNEVAVWLKFLDSVQQGSIFLFFQDFNEENSSV